MAAIPRRDCYNVRHLEYACGTQFSWRARAMADDQEHNHYQGDGEIEKLDIRIEYCVP